MGLALGSAGRPAWFVASAAIAVAAVSVNYASAVPLAPTLLYGLFASSRSVTRFLLRALLYLVVSLAVLGAALGLMALGGADLDSYFSLQGRFLSAYSGDRRLPGPGFLIQCAVSVGVLSVLAAPGVFPRPQLRVACRAMALLIVFSLLYFVLSTKFYPHYAFMVTAPAAVVLLSIDDSRLRLRAAMGCLLVGAAAIQAGMTMAALRHPQFAGDLYQAYAALRDAVRDEPLMSMQSSVVPLYFSGLRAYQPLVWPNHAEIIHGQGADAYYAELLETQPPFVMTEYDLCTRRQSLPNACAVLNSRYDEVQSVPSGDSLIGYSLYELGH